MWVKNARYMKCLVQIPRGLTTLLGTSFRYSVLAYRKYELLFCTIYFFESQLLLQNSLYVDMTRMLVHVIVGSKTSSYSKYSLLYDTFFTPKAKCS